MSEGDFVEMLVEVYVIPSPRDWLTINGEDNAGDRIRGPQDF
jgi:hypothetical protein